MAMTVHDVGRSVGRGVRGRGYASFRLLSLTRSELHPAPLWTGAKSARLFADYGSCATARVRAWSANNRRQ
jgi:hypothetical protein